MAKQQRTMRIEQRSQLAAMQQLESRSDDELESETKFKAAAQAILGAPAAERYDPKDARRPGLTSSPRWRRPVRRNASSCGGWQTRHWRWPSAAPMTSRRPRSDSGS